MLQKTTKQQRKKAYNFALSRIDSELPYMCNSCLISVGINPMMVRYDCRGGFHTVEEKQHCLKQLFPELMLFQPNGWDSMWFEGNETIEEQHNIRETILYFCLIIL